MNAASAASNALYFVKKITNSFRNFILKYIIEGLRNRVCRTEPSKEQEERLPITSIAKVNVRKCVEK